MSNYVEHLFRCCSDRDQTEDHYRTSTLAVSLGRASLIKPRNELPHVSTRPSPIHRTRVVARATNLGPQKSPAVAAELAEPKTRRTPRQFPTCIEPDTRTVARWIMSDHHAACHSLISGVRQPNVFDRKHAHNDTNGTANNHTVGHNRICRMWNPHMHLPRIRQEPWTSEYAFPACEIHNATTSFLGRDA